MVWIVCDKIILILNVFNYNNLTLTGEKTYHNYVNIKIIDFIFYTCNGMNFQY